MQRGPHRGHSLANTPPPPRVTHSAFVVEKVQSMGSTVGHCQSGAGPRFRRPELELGPQKVPRGKRVQPPVLSAKPFAVSVAVVSTIGQGPKPVLCSLTFTGTSVVWKGHYGFVYFVAFSPDGLTALSASGDKTIRKWNVATGVLEAAPGPVMCG